MEAPQFTLEHGTTYGVSGDHLASMRLFHMLAATAAAMGERVLILSPLLSATTAALASMLADDDEMLERLARIQLACMSDIAHVVSTLAAIDSWSTTRCIFVDALSLCPPHPDIYELAHIRSTCLALKRIATVHRAIVVVVFRSSMTQWLTSHHVLLTPYHPSTSSGQKDMVTAVIARTGATCLCSLSTVLMS
ncbi:hypothetical protein H310_00297 [Aphanomyces invadans]|uniref:DNA recombination and repair protein Rad51-like C-terminal domain-containing protein n=1 Tax=Aphanomyces invadans TaxID=157072 RepID=A0A024UV60_9STRA|nr:hypothetical protein H310_00297 [Aphanomyces invadans]ETW09840.1 hypothetical protein H310_00297 [Aphanomyces invadans]|eukprot:XP_008861251.1 hypothetical protein H310_00297 [Aphanomyces invadans]